MTYFPKFGPFYDPAADREFYEERNGHLSVKDPGADLRRSARNGSASEQLNLSFPHHQ